MFNNGLKAVAGATTVDTGVGGNLNVSEYPVLIQPKAETPIIAEPVRTSDAGNTVDNPNFINWLKSLLGL